MRQLIKTKSQSLITTLILASFMLSFQTKADIVTDWNIIARDIIVDSKLNTPYSNRALAIVHTAIYKAVLDIDTQQHSKKTKSDATQAAIASASRMTLKTLVPNQSEMIEKHYLKAINNLPEGKPKNSGIKTGVDSAHIVLSSRLKDNSDSIESYRPTTEIGKYVPTVIPAVPQWMKRTPWLMKNADQFLPKPPPALSSKQWAIDLNEVKSIGHKNSKTRNQEQTKIAKFWEATLPPIYHGVVHSVANLPGRSILDNARLFAAITRATDDAMISVFDAKYHFALWRPITAIRNSDKDNNSDTVRDATWLPYIKTPMHPEYPCAHCVIAGTVGTVLQAEIDKGNYLQVVLSTKSMTANNETRYWNSIEEFIQEVSEARIYDGVHYRTSTEVGTEMGRKIGRLAIEKYLYSDH